MRHCATRSSQSLVLVRLTPKMTGKRCPGPGPIRKMEWASIGQKHLQNRRIVFHTDSAKSYKLRIDGVIHDKVAHQKKRVKAANGKWGWVSPKYVKIALHKLPKIGTLKVKAGTQIIDRCRRYLKDRVHLNQHSKAGTQLIKDKLRAAQYQYWHKDSDM